MNRAYRRKHKIKRPRLLPEGQYAVLANSNGFFAATNADPRDMPKWKAREHADGTTTYYQ